VFLSSPLPFSLILDPSYLSPEKERYNALANQFTIAFSVARKLANFRAIIHPIYTTPRCTASQT